MKLLPLIYMVILAMCFGCATQQQWVDSFKYNHNVLKKEWKVEDVNSDHETCSDYATRIAWGVLTIDKEKFEKIYRKCMEEERGWRVK